MEFLPYLAGMKTYKVLLIICFAIFTSYPSYASMVAACDSIDFNYGNGGCFSIGHSQPCPVTCYFNHTTCELSLCASDSRPILFTITNLSSGDSICDFLVIETSLTITQPGLYEIRITLPSEDVYIGYFICEEYYFTKSPNNLL
jgi:hypothetical protein